MAVLVNRSKKCLGMKLRSVRWQRALLPGTAAGCRPPYLAHVNSPAVYPVPLHHSIYARVSAPGCRPWLLGCAHLISAPKPGWAPRWLRAPPAHGPGAPGGACGGDRSAARACAPELELRGCWLGVLARGSCRCSACHAVSGLLRSLLLSLL